MESAIQGVATSLIIIAIMLMVARIATHITTLEIVAAAATITEAG